MVKRVFYLLLVILVLCGCHTSTRDESSIQDNSDKESNVMRIRVDDGKHSVVFELNDSKAAVSLYKQLPLTVKVENYSNNEKIFYPDVLDVSDTPLSKGRKYDLAYFKPWDNVVMYYGDAGPYSGLYDLGRAIENGDMISKLKGTVKISKE